jgi:translation initiation factor 6 (eIF-6)
MTTTLVKNGQLITSTATEQDLQPDGVFEDGSVQLVQAEVVSGTIYFGVGPVGGSPVINGSTTYGSYTTAGKSLRTVDAGSQNFRCVGVGTFIISW